MKEYRVRRNKEPVALPGNAGQNPIMMTLPKPYYSAEGITIYHGDCREILPYLEPVDLVLTDPPYNFESKGGGFYGNWHGGGHEARKYIGDLDSLGCCSYEPLEVLNILPSKYGYFFCNKTLLCKYIQYSEKNSLLFDVHVMHKTNPIPAKNSHFLHDLEYIVLIRPQGSFFNPNKSFKNYSKFFTTICKPNNLHPAEKPVALMKKYIDVSLNENGTVLDPFMGSGTTLVAAKQLGRKAIGIEISEKYCAVAVDRLRQKVLPL
jgi:DNA modification methylase